MTPSNRMVAGLIAAAMNDDRDTFQVALDLVPNQELVQALLAYTARVVGIAARALDKDPGELASEIALAISVEHAP